MGARTARMIHKRNYLRDMDWDRRGSVITTESRIEFMGNGGSIAGDIKDMGVHFAPDEFTIDLWAEKPTDKYNPTAFIRVDIEYNGGDTFVGIYPIINERVKVEPEVDDKGERDEMLGLYHIDSFKVGIKSSGPFVLERFSLLKTEPYLVEETDDGITRNEDGSYDIGDSITGGGGIDGGGGNGGAISGEYIKSVPVNHTVYDPFSIDYPNEEIDAYVDGVVMMVEHQRRPDFSRNPNGSHPDGEFIDADHTPPLWARGYHGYGEEGPRLIKYLLANDGRIYINWDDGDVFYITSDFIDAYQAVHGYYVDEHDEFYQGNCESLPWVLATDDDFEPIGTSGRLFQYIGNAPYVEIPHTIQGVDITSYNSMFSGSRVRGVKSTNRYVTTMEGMFSSSRSKDLDVRCLDTSSVVSMSNMFSRTEARNIRFGNFDTSSVTNMQGMFYNVSSNKTLIHLDLSSFDTSNVVNMQDMFMGNTAQSIDLSRFDTSNVTNMRLMFYGSYAPTLDLSSFDTSSVSDSWAMFQDAAATKLYARTTKDANFFEWTGVFPRDLQVVVWEQAEDDDFEKDDSGNYRYIGRDKHVEIPNTINGEILTSYDYMFAGTKVNSVKSKSNRIKSMSHMFDGVNDHFTEIGTTLDLSALNTSSAEDMSGMFMNCGSLNLIISGMDTSSVTDMRDMFRGTKATAIDVTSFRTSNVRGMNAMFMDSEVLVLDLSSFDMSKVIGTMGMFKNAKATEGYARTSDDARILNESRDKPNNLIFEVK